MALHYILDGYNIIKKIPYLRNKKLKTAREQLLKFIEIYRPQGSHKNQITVVFDGSDEVFVNAKCDYDARTIFSRNQKADDFIKSFVDKSKNAKNICVVSDDKDIRLYCRASGAIIIDVVSFMNKGTEPKRKNLSKEDNLDYLKISPSESAKITEELKSVWLK